jgi:hypothetical protein
MISSHQKRAPAIDTGRAHQPGADQHLVRVQSAANASPPINPSIADSPVGSIDHAINPEAGVFHSSGAPRDSG